jgi:hypothetical protein
LDQNVSESVLQYNLSYGNDGPGFLVYTGVDNTALTGNTVRFNISSDDGRRSSRYGGITLNGRVSNTAVYNNTVVTFGDWRRQPPALLLGTRMSGVTIRNNIFRADVTAAVVKAPGLSTNQVLLQGNNYVNGTAPLAIWWGEKIYETLSRWRADSGQERLGGVDTGIRADPWPSAPRVAGTPRRIEAADVTAFMLEPGSPATGKGLDLGQFNLEIGDTDFWGNPLTGRRPSVGAHQP